MTGRFNEAIREMLRARELDPMSPSIMQSLGWAYYHSRHFAEAETTFQQMLEMAPDMAYGLATYSWTLRHIGKNEQAVATAEKALSLSSGGQFYVAVLGAAYAAAGRVNEAKASLQRLDEMSATDSFPYHRALIQFSWRARGA